MATPLLMIKLYQLSLPPGAYELVKTNGEMNFLPITVTTDIIETTNTNLLKMRCVKTTTNPILSKFDMNNSLSLAKKDYATLTL